MTAVGDLPLLQQAILVLGALVLFLSFVMLAQARTTAAIHAFAWQGALLAGVTAMVATMNMEMHLFFSAALTFLLKALVIPWMLHRMVRRLELNRHVDAIERHALVLMAAVALVIFSYWLVLPIVQQEFGFLRNIIAVSLAAVLVGLLMMIARQQALLQVIGFMSIENGLFLTAVSATRGMPLVVELGIAFDVLVAVVLFGVFLFQVQESIDSLDVDLLNRLREHEEDAG
jgi:hydrogenase-4 component E